ncbi:hypothetical protein H6F86_02665 [Phormidium sp. FACHB-592]|uniref:Uncharacterized protein n=1 Tax=Stenomitos frigidus AS-A4 TaxID=2933935 RepID=A0ABV0KK22_9CYAN|nr:hypothetical protein [Phormidium sp. FACHB-592]MBD2072808.1 hypothetical protein [Phormidium sp. FACHB-592]
MTYFCRLLTDSRKRFIARPSELGIYVQDAIAKLKNIHIAALKSSTEVY